MIRRLNLTILIMILLLTGQNLFSRTGGNLYRILRDENGKPVRLIFVRSLKEKAPEPYLFSKLGYRDPVQLPVDGGALLYDRKKKGDIPVLCFHRIGEDGKYELSLPRVHHLMATLVRYRFFPMSDKDFARGDFSSVPAGMKPIVLGADDAGATQLLWSEDTLKAYSSSHDLQDWTLDPNCLASIFSRYFEKSRDRYNLSFYISFDAIPFRQLAGQLNPGYPYEGSRIIGDKIRYAWSHYHIGYHGLSHTFREQMSIEAFVREIEESSRILSDYLDYPVRLPTLAYPYGSGHFTEEEEQSLLKAVSHGRFPEIAFDLNGEFSPPPWSAGFRSWDISRFSVENDSFDLLLRKLSGKGLYTSDRVFLIHSETKRIRLEEYNLDLGSDDVVYVYIP